MFLLLVTLPLIWSTFAEHLLESTNTACTEACFTAISTINFQGEKDHLKAPCTNPLNAQSTWLCAKEYCIRQDIELAESRFKKICKVGGKDAIPFSSISNITSTTIQQLQILDLDQHEMDAQYTRPVRLSQSTFTQAVKTVNVRKAAMNTHIYYGWSMICFWLFVVSFGFGMRFLNTVARITPLRTRILDLDTVARLKGRGLIIQLKSWFKRYFTVPAAFFFHCHQPVGMCSIPPRLQTCTIAVFVAVNFVLCCVNYHPLASYFGLPKTHTQLAHYIADRCGILAVSNMPIMWLFAQRNNFLLWLTGWSFSTFNNFHRWIARVVTFQAIVHGICFSVYHMQVNKYKPIVHQLFWQMGVVAIGCMGLILVISNYTIRHRAYEMFLAFHIAFATILLLGLYIHLDRFAIYRVYLWPCVAVWAVDPLVRICRLLILQATKDGMKAAAQYDASADVIHLNVPVSSLATPKAGQYYYVYLINNLWKAWESHPFTVSTWGPRGLNVAHTHTLQPIAASKAQTKFGCEIEQVEACLETPQGNPSADLETGKRAPTSTQRQTISFMIRPYNSFTARLRNACSSSAAHVSNIRVAVEGPYGAPLGLSSYPRLLFIVGGTGVTVPLSYLCQLGQNGRVPGQTIEIAWAMRERHLLRSALKHGLQDRLNQLGGSAKVSGYFTSGYDNMETNLIEKDAAEVIVDSYPVSSPLASSPSPAISPVEPDKETLTKSAAISTTTMPPIASLTQGDQPRRTPLVEERRGRPPITSLVSACTADGSRACVITCGPPAMSDEVRKAVVDLLSSRDHGLVDIDFRDEGFGW